MFFTSNFILSAVSSGTLNCFQLDKYFFYTLGSVSPAGECVVPGWGQTAEGGRVSDSLMKVTVPIVTDEECQEMYDALPYDDLKIADSMICAGPIEGGKGTCRVSNAAFCSFFFLQIIRKQVSLMLFERLFSFYRI